jgi:hypothetical protein
LTLSISVPNIANSELGPDDRIHLEIKKKGRAVADPAVEIA